MSSLEQLYQQVILDHARERHAYGLREGAAGESFQVNPTCGDEVRLRVHIDFGSAGDGGIGGADSFGGAGGGDVGSGVLTGAGASGREVSARPRISGVSWEGHGCSISQASISVMSDLVTGTDVLTADAFAESFRALMHHRGEPLGDSRDEELGDAAAFVGVAKYPARVKCALLGWMALRDALAHALVKEES
ncbi:SUF system FeS assembly protein, NifU family [Beutenbergia cavernae DSM 12333]|uniref:SUF system FeS assembly protein, NifU family n=1 Tax=Beutenbergia cavernae (strain ATCC BAA-8 / DSM 12333 / CCUG 43141 / JCM 11478 / NBRC 16432 / NCIMB 13614 / HKI 0122) TaxID=471853 RepID=C5BVY5_BEUC1|nr:iron-sulfur cluster assembly scaffold protein [Beutenbergia cavernae]ACQ80586.1 SUF system FeS assembly protein, NifU family [Beutenbergia cavernae DSM 12333]